MPKKPTFAGWAIAAGTLMVLIGAQVALASDRKIVVTGSSTVAPLIAEIGKRYEARNPSIRVDVQAGGSARGLADVRAGSADIGMVSRALKNDERDLRAFEIARDGIGIIVHRSNQITNLTDTAIVDIFSGRKRDWGSLTKSAGPITVVNKAEGRSTLELFLQHFRLKATDIKPSIVIGDNQQGIKTISGIPGAIGYVSIGTAEYEQSAGAPIRLLGIGGVIASTENVRNGTYPLARPLNLVTTTEPQGRVKDFIDFARSGEVRDIVEEQFFVPVRP